PTHLLRVARSESDRRWCCQLECKQSELIESRPPDDRLDIENLFFHNSWQHSIRETASPEVEANQRVAASELAEYRAAHRMRPFQLHMADQWVHTVQYWRAFARHSVGNANAIRRGAVADFRLHHGFSVLGSWFSATT